MSRRLSKAEDKKPCKSAEIISINLAMRGFYKCPKGHIFVPLDCIRAGCPAYKGRKGKGR